MSEPLNYSTEVLTPHIEHFDPIPVNENGMRKSIRPPLMISTPTAEEIPLVKYGIVEEHTPSNSTR
jgi:hypothetical protein